MNAKPRHVPERTCIVCRQKAAKRQLTRFVRSPEGVFADPSGKRDGRGAYLCDNPNCRQRAATTDVLAKALNTVLTADDRQRIQEVAAS
jgi:predicted RNA-binding protein YlxR (DUF448 family)